MPLFHPTPRESNRTVARFTHNGKAYVIHERGNTTSDGARFVRRLICDADGAWCGYAWTVRLARKVLDGLLNKHDDNKP